jgi:O-acetyl-ADP-ribose deacetylase
MFSSGERLDAPFSMYNHQETELVEFITVGGANTEHAARIECVEGDITDQDTDAIVNAANSELWMGSGVAGAIKRKGGVGIEREAISKGPIAPGEAVVTGAGNLPASYVIHAAAMGSDLQTSESLIRSATRGSLQRAAEQSCQSVSFPSLGTGVGGFSMDRCAAIMVDEAAKNLVQPTPVTVVRFVLFGIQAYEVFVAELRTRRA